MKQAFATLAIETVLAADLSSVPVEQVITARKALGDELTAFREFVRSLSGELSELSGVEDPRLLRAHLQQVVDTQVQPRLRELEKGMRLLKLEPVRGAELEGRSGARGGRRRRRPGRRRRTGDGGGNRRGVDGGLGGELLAARPADALREPGRLPARPQARPARGSTARRSARSATRAVPVLATSRRPLGARR
jgi:hypothetical protein